jgi:pilus assembly protein Flp/PilA
MLNMLKQLWKDEEGAAAAEYILILALIALGIVVGAGSLGDAMNTAMETTGTQITDAIPAGE